MQIALIMLKMKFDNESAETIEAVKLSKTFSQMIPIEILNTGF
jgi:hypothetical protein